MSYYYSASSNYPSPARKLSTQKSIYFHRPPSSSLVGHPYITHPPQKIKPMTSSRKLESTGNHSRLGSLISKFEALDSVAGLSKISGMQNGDKHLASFPRCAIGSTTTNSPPRKLSTIIFSPRPPSTGRYENVFIEDKSPIMMDDVFTCPPYNSVGSVGITGLEMLKCDNSPPKTSSFYVRDLIRKSSKIWQVEGVKASQSRQRVNVNRFRDGSMKDRIRFYDGGSDLPTPSRINGPKSANRATSYPRQSSIIPVTPVHVKMDNPGPSSRTSTAKNHNSTLESSSKTVFCNPSSVSRSRAAKTPGSTPRTYLTEGGSAQKSESSPLRERRLARSSLPRKSWGSIPPSTQRDSSSRPQSTDRASAGERGQCRMQHLDMERKQPLLEWKQVGEKIGELYRARSQERTSLYVNQGTLSLDQVGSLGIMQKAPVEFLNQHKQADGPAMSRKPSKIASLRAIFDPQDSELKSSSGHLSVPLDIIEGRLRKAKGHAENLPVVQCLRKAADCIGTDLSMILERTEQSSSTSLMENSQLSLQGDKIQGSVQDENRILSLPAQSALAQISGPNKPKIMLSEQRALLPSIEIQNPEQEEIFSVRQWTPTLTTVSVGEAKDLDRTMTPPLPEDARLWVPKKRSTAEKAAGISRVRIPYVADLSSSANEVKPLRLPKRRPLPEAQETRPKRNKPLIFSPPQGLRFKTKAIQDRIKLFECKALEVPVNDRPLRKESLRSKPNSVLDWKLKKSKHIKQKNTDISIRRVLSANTIQEIVAGFHDRGVTISRGKRSTTAATPNFGDMPGKLEPGKRKKAEVNGATELKSQLDMVVKEVECETVAPKPVRLAETNRMKLLCRGKADKTARHKKQ